jgi:hypothetical protein
VVSRGGRPDLAVPYLAAVRAPTLLIVGGHDEIVLELNKRVQSMLRCPNRLAVVPGATHLFSEPGTLEQAAMLARDWFLDEFRADTGHGQSGRGSSGPRSIDPARGGVTGPG